ncbi:MAG: DUF1848 domain-containing protein [Eubacteriales bacterium]|nr:DUF1848 domain-containing protein [Eubacteriales bacterium]
MILSASRRTDIPCYYSEWFMNRIRAGYVLTRNPMNHAQLSRVLLSPDVVDCIVFWTKDAKKMLPHLDELDHLGYKYYFQFTLTPYDKTIEENLRDKAEIEDTFTQLSKMIGKERVIWRYDPIVLNGMFDISYHKEQFNRMCDKLFDYTKTVTISFVDMYSKLKTNAIRPITDEEVAELSAFISITAKAHGLRIVACCEKMDLSVYGIEKASCIDKTTIQRICGAKLDVLSDKNQRPGCGCYQSTDIGAYNTCKNGCVYCYANYSESSVKSNCEKHNPNGALLIGEVKIGEKIIDRKVKSNIISQQGLF